MTKHNFLTKKWNNWLTIGLGFPIILAFTTIIDYRTGFIAFFVIILTRAIANLYRNNFLTLEQAEIYPFRIP